VDKSFLETYWGEWYRFTADLQERDLASIQKMWEVGKEIGMSKSYPEIKSVTWR
jgi:hypothetical protein